MGVDTMGHPTIPFDITNKKFAQNYFDVLLHPYEKEGVDFWWLDWQQWGGTNIKGVNPTFYLNYVHFSDMQRQGKRPLIFHRWGGLGNHRYEIGFSGDYFINWKSLKYQPEFTATAANVGFGYWSHDIGGHTEPHQQNRQTRP
jgi:alpha-glucosidase (family GH31 glycosyl hydrolase)